MGMFVPESCSEWLKLILTCILLYIFFVYICTVHRSWKYLRRCLNLKYYIYSLLITYIYILYIYIICKYMCVCLVHSQFETEMQECKIKWMCQLAQKHPTSEASARKSPCPRFKSLGQRNFAGLCQENPKRSCPTFRHEITWMVVSNMFHFHPYLGKIPILTNIFQRGWNHQLVTNFSVFARDPEVSWCILSPSHCHRMETLANLSFVLPQRGRWA